MKCPKCGYVSFERSDKCRNCGYHFSLADNAAEVDLPLRTDEPLVPPADFKFSTGVTPAPAERRRTPPPGGFDLPSRTPRRVPQSSGEELPLFSLDGTPRVASQPSARPAPGEPQQARPRPRSEARTEPRAAQLALEPDPHSRESRGQAVRSATTRVSAGPLARATGGFVDALILGGLDLAVVYFTLRVCRLSFGDLMILPFAPLVAFFLLLDGAYLVAFTASGGQTIGKMAASIRVIAEDGSRVTPGQALMRTAGYLASGLPAGLGFVPGLFGPTRRALHDRLANTRVVRT